jgi:hypothetical protein
MFLSKKYPEINTISMFNYWKWTDDDFASIEQVSFTPKHFSLSATVSDQTQLPSRLKK